MDYLDVMFQQMSDELQKLYRDKATIYGVETKKTDRGIVSKPKATAENCPCKISISSPKASEPNGIYGTDAIDAMLYLDKSVTIPAGAKIDVTLSDGSVLHFKNASKGYQEYQSHQEVALTKDDKARD